MFIHKISLTVGLIAIFFQQGNAATFYVKAGAAGGGTGLSWAKAFNNLDSALSAAASNNTSNQIWVAKGTYIPKLPTGAGNSVTFKLPKNVTIYGGFAGSETSSTARNRDANPTILSGDIGNNDTYSPTQPNPNVSDNAWHVLTADGVTGVKLDGLIVKGGYAGGTDRGTFKPDLINQSVIDTLEVADDAGGGFLVRHGAQVSLNNMRFEYNTADATNGFLGGNPLLGSPPVAAGGGAIAAIDEGTLVTITNSSFRYNNATSVGCNGGALHALKEASFNISTSSFENNTASRNGGAVHGKDADTIKVVLSSFENNKAVGASLGDESGGAIGTIDTNLSVSASYFEGNQAGVLAGGGGAIIFHTPLDDHEIYTLTVDNSIFNNNRSFASGGGAINIFGVHPKVGSNARITNSVFTGNVGGIGGAMHVSSLPTVVDKCFFSHNDAWVAGGAIYGSNILDILTIPLSQNVIPPVLSVSNSIFYSNTIIGTPANAPFTVVGFFNLVANAFGPFFGGEFSQVFAVHPGGGAISAGFDANLAITNASFISNKANNSSTDDGGALLVGGTLGVVGAAGQGLNQAKVKLCNGIFVGNTAATSNKNIAVQNLGTSPDGVVYINSCR